MAAQAVLVPRFDQFLPQPEDVFHGFLRHAVAVSRDRRGGELRQRLPSKVRLRRYAFGRKVRDFSVVPRHAHACRGDGIEFRGSH